MRGLNCIAVLLIAALATYAPAQSKKPSGAGSRSAAEGQARRNTANNSPGMTKARQAAALAFVQEHHPQLQELLIQLAESQPKQYEAAIRDLFRTSERLAVFHEKDPQRYELELASWKLSSRVQLLSATLLMTPSDEKLKAKLKQTMLEQAGVRRELLVLERDRMNKRLERINSQIEKLDADLERTVEKQIKLLLDGDKKSTPTTTKIDSN